DQASRAIACLCWRRSPLLAANARDSFWRECTILSTNGFSPPKHSEQERRDERAEMVAIAISLVLIIGAFLAIIVAVLLSRPSSALHVSAQWIPWLAPGGSCRQEPTWRPSRSRFKPRDPVAHACEEPTFGAYLLGFVLPKNARQRGTRRRNQPLGQAARPRAQRLMRRCGRFDRAATLGFVLPKCSSQTSLCVAGGAASRRRIANLRRDSARRS